MTTHADASTTTPGTGVAPAGYPPVVDRATWQAARDALLVREKAHTRAGDALAAERRRLPMVEVDATAQVVGPDGPVPFLDLFGGRDELCVYKHMWHDGAPHQGQCEGCTVTAWHLRDASYLAARGVAYAVLTTGIASEVAAFTAFMGYTEPWYSVRGIPVLGDDMGSVACFVRDGDRVFLTYETTGRGVEAVSGIFALLDMTVRGRGEAWQETPDGWPQGHEACWYWRTDVEGRGTWGPTGRPTPQWTRPGAVPEETLGRHGEH